MKTVITLSILALAGIAVVALPGCSGDKGGQQAEGGHDEHAGHEGSAQKKAEKAESDADLKPQETCPVMGNPINKDHYVDYNGKRVYFCCPGCDSKFKKEPEKYLKKLRDMGEKPVDVP